MTIALTGGLVADGTGADGTLLVDSGRIAGCCRPATNPPVPR